MSKSTRQGRPRKVTDRPMSMASSLPIIPNTGVARSSPPSLAATDLRQAWAAQHTCRFLSSPYSPSYRVGAFDRT